MRRGGFLWPWTVALLAYMTPFLVYGGAAVDRWGYPMTCTPEAIVHYNDAVLAYVKLRGDLSGNLAKAIATDPNCVMAHIYLGSIMLLSTGVNASSPVVQTSYRSAYNLVVKAGKANPREKLHFSAFQSLLDENFEAAASSWESVLDQSPRDLLAVRSAHDAYIILGDVRNLRDSTGHVLARWGSTKSAGADKDVVLVKSMWAFALEESGDYVRAAGVAKESLTIDDTDVTALHALAHAHEEVSDIKGGSHAYEEYDGDWQGSNLFANHVAWHKALFQLEQNKSQEALDIYDTFLVKDDGKGGKTPPEAPLAMADASSLLWRVGLKGVSVGDRWPILAGFWRSFDGRHTTSFGDMHRIMALASVDVEEARREVQALKEFAETESPFAKDQAGISDIFTSTLQPTNRQVLRDVGLNASEGLLAYAEKDYKRSISLLYSVISQWQKIGGSHAQRDILMLTLIAACLADKTDLILGRRLLAERAAIKDPLNQAKTWTLLAQVEHDIQSCASCGGKEEEQQATK